MSAKGGAREVESGLPGDVSHGEHNGSGFVAIHRTLATQGVLFFGIKSIDSIYAAIRFGAMILIPSCFSSHH